jgi:hypothetical protein
MKPLIIVLSTALCLFSLTDPEAQELDPRAYWVTPSDLNLIFLSYVYVNGPYTLDPVLPAYDVESTNHAVVLGYYRSFSLLGRSANFTLTEGYTRGTFTGELPDDSDSLRISGLTDSSFRFAVNLKGGPAMDPKGLMQFRARPKTLIGTSIRVVAPTGQYHSERPVNPGLNRWSYKPQLGTVFPIKPKWLLELNLGVWLFGTNEDFLGAPLEQDPLASAELNFVHRIRPALWAAFNINYFYGGTVTESVYGKYGRQNNSRIGGTIAVPIGKSGHALKFQVFTGLVTTFGGDATTLLVGYACGWR